ncbi:unnamed protein product [Hermetia illucens]|uniref:Galactosylgalactosylxylosylprotein 3-beta-glucuronosyltransferase n=1 Tax=Hermetia illucens TaxID=343691 RepID=A0A7R8YWS9_HERIL|nr:galactosylgalactosylxylosylprotein 3-beta-glucuronosyltransferase I [Hermetia illucens]CAD7087680.1 unnamed protein product [Hermetia illucens]
MGEIHLRPRQIIIIVVIFVVIILFITNTRQNCEFPKYYRSSARKDDLPTIFAITPTYYRPVQKAELTRLSHVVMLVPNVHWIIVEDADHTSSLVTNLLQRAGLVERSTQLSAKTPTQFKLQGKDPNWSKPRGVEQRNAALRWIRENTSKDDRGVVYFMDDDNAYSVELFEEMNKIQAERVGVWPVGLVGGLMVEKPILNNENIVTGFNAAWRPERPFPLDMAGFAISLDLLHKRPEAVFSFEVERGYQESEILRHVTVLKELQPLANLCKEVLVWHTRTEKPKLTEEEKLRKAGKSSFDGIEV